MRRSYLLGTLTAGAGTALVTLAAWLAAVLLAVSGVGAVVVAMAGAGVLIAAGAAAGRGLVDHSQEVSR